MVKNSFGRVARIGLQVFARLHSGSAVCEEGGGSSSSAVIRGKSAECKLDKEAAVIK